MSCTAPGPVINYRPEDPNIRIRDNFLEVLSTPLRAKLGMDSQAGWFAYLDRNDLLWVKRYPVYPDRPYGELAGLTISIWYYEDLMCELEPIGPARGHTARRRSVLHRRLVAPRPTPTPKTAATSTSKPSAP